MNAIEIFKSADNITEFQVRFEEDSVWISQQQMASLFNQAKH